eukprot:6157681-Pleurochrysis_carterae.AAC.6
MRADGGSSASRSFDQNNELSILTIRVGIIRRERKHRCASGTARTRPRNSAVAGRIGALGNAPVTSSASKRLSEYDTFVEERRRPVPWTDNAKAVLEPPSVGSGAVQGRAAPAHWRTGTLRSGADVRAGNATTSSSAGI